MKKLVFAFLGIFCFYSNCFSSDAPASMNIKIRWSGEAITTSIENAYKSYLHDLMEDLKVTELSATNADKENLAKKLLEQEKFSLNDALDICVKNRKITPNDVCKKVVNNLMNFASNTTQNTTDASVKKQICRIHELSFKGLQGKYDNEFLYTYADWMYGKEKLRGYECDPNGAEDACDSGDEVTIADGFLGGKRVSGRYRCVRGITGDKWENVGDAQRYSYR